MLAIILHVLLFINTIECIASHVWTKTTAVYQYDGVAV